MARTIYTILKEYVIATVVKRICSRLHYASDWVVDNVHRGNLKDVTPQIAETSYQVKTLDFMTAHRDKYPALKDDKTYEKMTDVERGYRSHQISIYKIHKNRNKRCDSQSSRRRHNLDHNQDSGTRRTAHGHSCIYRWDTLSNACVIGRRQSRNRPESAVRISASQQKRVRNTRFEINGITIYTRKK